MAIGHWALLGEFDPFWFLPNLALLIWPLFFLGRIIASLGSLPMTVVGEFRPHYQFMTNGRNALDSFP
jgi:hypothetical protein